MTTPSTLVSPFIVSPFDIDRELRAVLALGSLSPEDAGGRVAFTGDDPVVSSVFRLGAIAAVGRMAPSVAAAALWKERGGGGQDLACDLARVVHELAPEVRLNGFSPPELQSQWVLRSGYNDMFVPTNDGRLVCCANMYPPLAEAIVDVLGLPPHRRDAIRAAIGAERAFELERRAAARGACVLTVRTEDEWEAEEQCRVLDALPLVEIERIGDSPPEPFAAGDRPLSGFRALGISRVLAGATIGTTLAEHGADVLNLWSPGAFETNAAYLYAHMGMRHAWLAEKSDAGRERLRELLERADIVFENRRDGVARAMGLDPEGCAARRPGIIHVSLRAFGHAGPWADRVGFDTPVMAAMGALAAEGTIDAPKKPPKTPINDWVAGWLGAFGAMAALRRRAREGGSWRVRVSLARTCRWWMRWPRIAKETGASGTKPAEYYVAQTPMGEFHGIHCQVGFSETPPRFDTVLEPIGASRAQWLPR